MTEKCLDIITQITVELHKYGVNNFIQTWMRFMNG